MRVPFSILILLAVGFCNAAWGQVPRSIDLMAYRTQVSPGSPEQDLLLVQRIVPVLARTAYPVLSGRSSTSFQAIDIEMKKRPRLRENMSSRSRIAVDFSYTFVVTGEIYQMVTEQFLSWRKGYEEQWIASATGETSYLKTPIQLVAEDPNLDYPQKVQRILGIMNRREYKYIPPPTPNPAYWPVSDVIPLREAGASLQFNPRGGKVVLLDDTTGETYILPFDPWDDPEDWLRDFERWVAGYGIKSSSEFAKKRAASVASQPTSLEDYLEAQQRAALEARRDSSLTGPPNPEDSVAAPAPLEPLNRPPDSR